MSYFKAKMHQILFPASIRSFVRSSVRPSLRRSLTLTHSKDTDTDDQRDRVRAFNLGAALRATGKPTKSERTRNRRSTWRLFRLNANSHLTAWRLKPLSHLHAPPTQILPNIHALRLPDFSNKKSPTTRDK